MKVQSIYSHTYIGLLWFDLPLGIVLTFIFHTIVRNAFINNSPTFFQSRLSTFISFDWNNHFRKNWSIVLLSILVGAASHLIWDDFTHEQGFIVQQFSVLRNNIKIDNQQVSIFKILQHASTLVGCIAIAFLVWRLPKGGISQKINYTYWIVALCLFAVIIAIKFLMTTNESLYGNIIVTGISAGLVALIVTPLLIQNKK